MDLQVEGGKVRAMQRLVSDALWDEEAMLETYHRLVQDEMSEPDGMLIVDETGFAKKGQDSVGVARQYCGALGKIENCQVGVFAAYASRQGYALVDKEESNNVFKIFRNGACGIPRPRLDGAGGKTSSNKHHSQSLTPCKRPAILPSSVQIE